MPENDEYTNIKEIEKASDLDTDGKDDFTEGEDPETKLEKAEISDKQSKEWESRYGKKGFWNKVKDVGNKIKQTLAGQTVVGKIGKKIKDVASDFGILPPWINKATDAVGSTLKVKTKQRSNMNWLLNRLTERSTWRGVIVALTSAGVLTLGEEMRSAIISAGVGLFVLVEVLVKEPESKDAKK